MTLKQYFMLSQIEYASTSFFLVLWVFYMLGTTMIPFISVILS